MTKTVALPAAGDSARLEFSFATMEKLHEKYGDHYVRETFQRLDLLDPQLIKLCIENMLIDAATTEIPKILEKMAASDLTLAIADAINLSINGVSLSDQIDEEDSGA